VSLLKPSFSLKWNGSEREGGESITY